MFPLFNKQYESQAKMKKVAPKQKKLQALYGDDRMKLQQEVMGLYKKEGVNPMAGCLPIIPTIFVFFALYKSVFINIDLRHAPFYGYIKDLAARDPLSILNGFGVLPWGPEPLRHLPLAYCCTGCGTTYCLSFSNISSRVNLRSTHLGVSLENLPPPGPPEICFAGRSNVGKSSLINALTNRNGLARASNTPGRTRELNYFNVDDRLRIVDLPGYGYARASKTDIAKWTQLTRAFLRGRAPLRRVFILIDSRHGIKPTDLELMDMLDEAAVTYQLIFTKVDKIKPPQVNKGIMKAAKVIKKRPAAFPEIIATSSVKKDGLDILKAEIASLALPDDK